LTYIGAKISLALALECKAKYPQGRDLIMGKQTLWMMSVFLAFVAVAVRAEEISTRVVDGLNRPIQAANFEVTYRRMSQNGKYEHVVIAKLITDTDGWARGHYDRKAAGSNDLWFRAAKEGYTSDTCSCFQSKVVLMRSFPTSAVDRLLQLGLNDQARELKELMAGSLRGDSLEERIFFYGDRLRQALRVLAIDQQIDSTAILAIASIGMPEDLDWVADHLPTPTGERRNDRWIGKVVASMVAPASEQAWSLLRDCAMGERYRGIAGEDAVRSLKFIASPRSRRILDEVLARSPELAESVRDAIDYIDSRPRPLEDRDLLALSDRVASLINRDLRHQNRPPTYNQRGDKAAVVLNFMDGRDLYRWDAVFHLEDKVWRFRGASETAHATLAVDAVR
jgi:hypothetical protein